MEGVTNTQILSAYTNASVPPWAGAVITVAVLSLSSPFFLQLTRPLHRLRKCRQCLGVGNNEDCSQVTHWRSARFVQEGEDNYVLVVQVKA
eukprot:Gb_16629 [translate_table: standard]